MTSDSDDAQGDARLNEILARYLQAAESGCPIDREQFIREHLEYEDELREFFADKGQLDEIAAVVPPGTSPPEKMTGPPIDAPTVPPESAAPLDAPTIDSVPTPNPPLSPGSVIRYFGDYELLDEIARGGMGVVYKARQIKLNRTVALKMILAGQLASKEDVQRFYTEAEAAAGLDHPGIVPIFEVGEHEDQHYFSMGFVDGESLAAKLTHQPLAPEEAAELVRKVAQAVQYAHERGVIHRDLKPANVLLDQDGQPKITDFGLAKQVQADSGMTATGQILGTPSYMPPEQAAGRLSEVSEQSDVYSLGAVLYAALTSRPPFQADNPLDTLMQVLEREPVPPRQLNPGVPIDLETVCLKCLEKDRERRYLSASELVDELTRFQNGLPIQARPVGVVERARKWSKRKPVSALLMSAGLAMFVAGLFLLGSAGFRAATANKALSVAIEPGEPVTTDLVNVDTSRLCSIGVQVNVQSDKVVTRTVHDPQTDESVERYTLQYHFPIRYRVLDAGGNVLHSQNERIAWHAGVRSGGDGTVASSTGGVIAREHYFAKFKVNDPGRVRIEAAIGPDEEFGATLQSANLILYDNVSRHSGVLLSGFGMICFAPLLVLVATLLTMSPRRTAGPSPAASASPAHLPSPPAAAAKEPAAPLAAYEGVPVWYASEDRARSLSKIFVFDDRGTLRITHEGFCFDGQKEQFNLNGVDNVSLARQRFPWKTCMILNAVVLASFALLGVVEAAQGEMATTALEIRIPARLAVPLIIVNGIGVLTVRRTKWVRVDHRGASGKPCASFFADSSARGWGGIFGGTEQLYATISAALCGKAAQPPTTPSIHGGVQKTSKPGPVPAPITPTNSGWAISSFILGVISVVMLCSFFPSLVTSPAAIVAGHLGLRSVRESRGRTSGAGLAIAGLVFGYCTLLVLIVLIGLFIAGLSSGGPIQFQLSAR